MFTSRTDRAVPACRARTCWVVALTVLLSWGAAAAQDRPAAPEKDKEPARRSPGKPAPSGSEDQSDDDKAEAAEDKNTPAARRGPVRTRPGRGVQKARPARGQDAGEAPSKPEAAGTTPKSGRDGQPEYMDPEVQRKIDELLRQRATQQEADPELQRQISELLQPKSGEAGAQPAGEEAAPPPIDPREKARQRILEQRKRLEEQRLRAGGQPEADEAAQPSQPAARQPSPGEEPAGPAAAMNIPPDEDPVRPEDRIYGFSIKNGTYEQLIEGFARQTGLGVIGDAPQGGTVNFVTTEQLTFNEALSRVRMLLFNYKPHEPYWLLRNENNLQVIRVTDLYRIIPPDRVFQSLEGYRAANLSRDEIALVFFTPKNASASDLTLARDFLPDYVRLTPVDQNRVAIFALVRDIERYLEFLPIVGAKANDPRRVERIEIQFTAPSDALNKLSQMTTLDGGGRNIQRATRPGTTSGLESLPEPGVVIVPDDQQGVLIVRAMPEKIAEIKELLQYIDYDTSVAGVGPVVIQLEHSTAEDVIPILQQMLAASPSTPDATVTPTRPSRRGRRATRSGGAGATAATADSITLVAHPSNTAVIVIASADADVDEVRRLIALVDVPDKVEWSQIPVVNADAASLRESLLEILDEPAPRGETSTLKLVAAPAGDALWFSGTPRQFDEVRMLVERLDVAADPVELRSVRLEFQAPTFVADILAELDGGAADPAQPQKSGSSRVIRRRGGRGGTSAPSPGKFKPDDATKTLWVFCTQAEWDSYLPVIKQLDVPPDADRPPFVRVPVEHVTAEEAVSRLSTMIGATQSDLTSQIRLVPTAGAILVVGASAREIERIEAFLAEADRPTVVERRTFEIQHADPAELQSVIETLLTGEEESSPASARSRVRQRRDAAQAGSATPTDPVISAEMTIVTMGNRMIVKATPERLEQIEALIAEFDVAEGGREVKVYDDFPAGADIEGIVDTLNSVLGGGGSKGRANIRRRDGGDTAEEPMLIPQPASGRLVVIATEPEFAQIEELIEVLQFEINQEPFVVDYVPVRYADPAEVVDNIEPVLAIKVRGMVSAGELPEPFSVDETATAQPAAVRRRQQQQSRVSSSGGGNDRYHLAPDLRNGRIVVAAPQAIVDEVRALVADFDIAGDEREMVFRTVELTNASPTDMIRAIKEMFGKPSPQRIAAVKRSTPAAQAAASAADAATGESLTIVEAPGGSAIILHGVKADVDQATEWITELDSMSTLGRVVRVYDVQYADVGKVFDLIVNVVDGSRASDPAPRRAPRQAIGKPEEPVEESEFTTSKTYTGQDLYIHADLIARTMLVAASPSKMTQVERLLENFEDDEIKAAVQPTPPIPKFTYPLKYADPTDAAWDLEDALRTLWEPPDELPKVEAATFTDALIIRYPHEDRFPDIRDMIRQYADVPDPELLKRVRRSRTPPKGISADVLARYLMNNIPDVTVELVDATPEEVEDYNIEEVAPVKNGGNPCVLPASLEALRQGLLVAAIRQSPPAEDEPAADDTASDEQQQPADGDLQDALIRDAAAPNVRVESQPPPQPRPERRDDDDDGERPADASVFAGEQLKIIYDKQTGEVILEGPSGIFDQVDDLISDLEEEVEEGVQLPPDIRVVRVRYIDVYSAQDVIEEMFNATRQQRAQAQRMQQQQMRVQQQQARLQAQRARQAAQQRGRQDEDQPQGRDAQQEQLEQLQQQMQTPQLPPTTVRVYPNPRDRTLILRADTSQYPQIYKLLATIDQPKPFNSFMRVYPLKKLNATEVEQILRDLLNLDADGGARSRGRAAAGGDGPSSAPGSQLPHTLLQETVSGTNQLGVDPEDIKIFASETANSIMAMAPEAALDHIGEIIENLESGDIPERVTKYYELAHASAEDVVEYLAAHFSGQEAGRSQRGIARGGPGATALAMGGDAPNAPSFIAYPTLNMLTVQATESQIAEIDEIIARLDVSTDADRWQDVAVRHVDPAQAADVLTRMFSDSPQAAGRGRGPATGGSGPRFIGEEGGNIVLFNAPQNLHEEIVATVEKLEREHEASDTIRVISLKHASARGVADAIEQAFAPGRGGRRGGGAPARFTITAHDASKQLFVKASDELFTQIESLVESLDQPQMPEFRIYPLKHANAKSVFTTLNKLMGEYFARLGRGADIEAFSVQVDETSNALIVLGGPTVFGFVEENLRMIDNPDAAPGRMVSETIPLVNVDAAELAQNLHRSWATRGLPPELTPQIDANRGTNALVIRGTQDQIDEMKRTVIEPLEKQGAEPGQLTPIKTYVLEFADPGSVADAVSKLFRPAGRSPRDQVVVTADYGSNSVIVAANPHNIRRIDELIAQIDTEASSGQGVHVLEIKHADPESVARTLNEVYVRGAQQRGRGGQQAGITIAAVAGSQAIVVRAKDDELARIRETLSGLDTPEVASGGDVRVITLLYAEANEVSSAMQEYLRKSTGGRNQLMGDVRISAMPQANAIMVAGAAEEVERLAGIINTMDVAGEKGNVPQIIPLEFINASLLTTTLQEVFTGPGRTRRGSTPPVIAADPTGDFLIVRASPTDLAAIEQMVTRMDTEDKAGQEPYKIVQVKAGINVADMADMVESAVNESAKARSGSVRGAQIPNIMAMADTRTNTITIAGSPALFADAETMIKTLEGKGPAGAPATRIIKTSNLSQDEIQSLIDQLTRGAGDDRPTRRSSPRSRRGRRP